MTRFDDILTLARQADTIDAWDSVRLAIVQRYGRRIAGSDQYIPTSESKRVEQSIVTILEGEA